MSKQTRASHPRYNLLPTEIEGFNALAEQALDMRWSWNHATDEVWRQLDPELWEITHNPWVVLQTFSATRLATDYTARILPHCAGVAVPLEFGPILWQR